MPADLTVTRVNHSCHLARIGATVENLPHLDAVVISHERYDHCDLDAPARYRDPAVPVLAPHTVVRRPGRTASPTSARWRRGSPPGSAT